MSNFRELEISSFLGIASSNRHPQKNECQECKNFDTRYIDGDLTVRPGFSQKYAAPAIADYRGKLSAITWPAFQNFYIPEGGGQEITLWIAKATLAGETAVIGVTPGTRNILAVFSSHQFNGTSWVRKNWDGSTDGSYWLNDTIVTTLTVDSTTNECELDFNNATIIANKTLNNWTIINISKSPYEVAQVIDTYDWVSGVGVNITNDNHDWDAGDTIILMRNYIPYDNLIAMYSCTANDISFHKVLNDIRIGFGGQENRVGLSVGYRKRALLLGDIDFGAFSASDIESLATTNNIILTPYYPISENQYKINISTTTGSGNELVAGKYFFRLTAIVDDFNEYLVSTSDIIINTASDLVVKPQIILGQNLKTITKLKIYTATTSSIGDAEATNPYYLLKEYLMTKETYSEGLYVIDEYGIVQVPIIPTEKHTDFNAALNNVTDYNAVAGSGTTGFFNFSGLTLTADSVEKYLGGYSVKFQNAAGTTLTIGSAYLTQTSLFKKGVNYKVSFYAKSSVVSKILSVTVSGTTTIINKNFELTGSFAEYSFEFIPNQDTTQLSFMMTYMPTLSYFNIDALSIIAYEQDIFTSEDIPSTGTEMSSALGYTPTFDMVKSWDQAIVTQGKTFFVNPYIDRRYENKIFSSHISGAGAFMYDVASAESYIDLENFDGNNLIGVEVLPNMQFVALKNNGYQRVNPNTGATEEIKLGFGCISRRSIVNFGDRVVWCGENDVFMTNGLDIISIVDKTIREEYRALTTKTNIIATREEKDNAYRFYTGGNKLEYIFTKKGWIKRVNGGTLYPDYYALSQDSTNWFMRSGNIYYDNDSERDYGSDIDTPTWQSVEFDNELIGEGLTERDFIFLGSIWVDCTYNEDPLNPNDGLKITTSIYGNGSLIKSTDTTLTSGRDKIFIRLTNYPPVRRFYIKLELAPLPLSYLYGKKTLIHSVGVMWKPIKSGHYN